MNMISQLRAQINIHGKAELSIDDYNQLQAEWINRTGAEGMIAAEREACATACETVQVRPIQGAHPEYIAGKEMALMQAVSAIRKRCAL